MTSPFTLACICACLAALTWVPLAQADAPNRAEADEHTLVITEADLSSELTYSGSSRKVEHEVQFEGMLTAPDADTFAAVGEHLWAVSAKDGDGLEVNVDNSGKSEAVRNTFAPLINGSGEVKLKRVSVPMNPHRLSELEVKARTIRVTGTRSVEIPANVSETAIPVGDGLSLRVEQMEIKRRGDANIEIDMVRGAGEGSPFIFAVFLLDKDGNEMGGGRWNDGELDLRDNDYMFKTEFNARNTNPVTTVRVELATEYRVEDVTFTVKGLMQE